MTSLPPAKRFDWRNLLLRVASATVLVPAALYATLGQHQHLAPAFTGRREGLPYLLLISIAAPLAEQDLVRLLRRPARGHGRGDRHGVLAVLPAQPAGGRLHRPGGGPCHHGRRSLGIRLEAPLRRQGLRRHHTWARRPAGPR